MGLRLSVGLFNISISGSFLVSNGFICVRTRLFPRKCYVYCDFCRRATQVPSVFIWLLTWTWTGSLVSATDATLDFGSDLKRCYDNDRLTSYITTHFYLSKSELIEGDLLWKPVDFKGRTLCFGLWHVTWPRRCTEYQNGEQRVAFVRVCGSLFLFCGRILK